MKTYIDAELQVVRLNNNDIVTLSTRNVELEGAVYSGDRMERESWDAGY